MLAKEPITRGPKDTCRIRRVEVGGRAERSIMLGDGPPPMGKTQRIRRDAHAWVILR